MKQISLFSLAGIFTLVTFLASQPAKAQSLDPEIGIKGGINLSNLYSEDVDDNNGRVGFMGGLYAKFPVSDFVAIQPELLYSARGNSFSDDEIFDNEDEATFDLNYIDLPVMLVLNVTEKFEIHGGPYVGYLVNAGIDGNFDNAFGNFDFNRDLEEDNFNRWDAGVGIGVAFNLNPITIGARYNLGLTEIADDEPSELVLGESKNSFGQIYLGFGF